MCVDSGDTTTNYVDLGGATNRLARFYRVRLVAVAGGGGKFVVVPQRRDKFESLRGWNWKVKSFSLCDLGKNPAHPTFSV